MVRFFNNVKYVLKKHKKIKLFKPDLNMDYEWIVYMNTYKITKLNHFCLRRQKIKKLRYLTTEAFCLNLFYRLVKLKSENQSYLKSMLNKGVRNHYNVHRNTKPSIVI